MSTPKIVVVFATDEAYFGLSRDLVSSLVQNVLPQRALSLVCLDIGLSSESKFWLAQQGVSVRAAELDRLPHVLQQIVSARPYMLAQLYRPYLPELAPNADLIVHIDCDAWAQNAYFVDACVEAINAAPQNIVLAPTYSHYSTSIYTSMQDEIDRQHIWTYGCYEKHIAEELAKMVFFSSGVFAAHPKSRVWKRWEEEIARIVPIVAHVNPSVLHLAEQTALNGVVRMDSSVTVLDPLCNFHCNAGGVRRDPASGKVVSALVHPNREISIVHLANWRQRRDEYIAAQLTFRPDSPPQTP